MLDSYTFGMQFIKSLYLKYQKEAIEVDGVYLKATFNGLSDLLTIDLKNNPYNTKMLVADLQFVSRLFDVSLNSLEYKVKNLLLSKLQEFPSILENISLFEKNNKALFENLNNHLNKEEKIYDKSNEISSDLMLRKIKFKCMENDQEDVELIKYYKDLHKQLLSTVIKLNKRFLLNLSNDVSKENPKQAIINVLLSKICNESQGSLFLLKVFNS